jgi:hypothetical protein
MANIPAKFVGASSVDSSMLFPKGKTNAADAIDIKKKPNKDRYAGILRYMPDKDFLIGRVAVTKNNNQTLKVFVDGAWDVKARKALETAKFTLVDPAGLESDKVPDLTSDDGWKATSKIEMRSNIHPQGHLSAKITFANAKLGETVDAYWCWP